MNLFEFEGKRILRSFGIPVPESVLMTDPQEPAPFDFPFVLKAQVMTGGRGKAGGVRVCRDEEDYHKNAADILGMEIKGHHVHGLLAEQMISCEREFYISITQQGVSVPTLIFSTKGGMDIESVAKESPEDIIKIEIDPFTGLKDYQYRKIVNLMGIDRKEGETFLRKLETAFFEGNASLVEINPVGVANGSLIALDSKYVIDGHARASVKEIEEIENERQLLCNYRTPEKETTTVTYVPLSGDVGLISDGAGTGMLTLDLMTDAGLDVACFTELGGMTTEEVMYRALELTLTDHPEIRALLIVLIGGFNRMDNMARGIVRYTTEHHVSIPVFTRMCGTMEEEGKEIMAEAGFQTYYDLTDTIEKLCKAVKGE